MCLSPADVGHLERLSGPEIRRRLGNNTQHFEHHRRENVVAYLEAWADLLEEQLRPGVEPIEPMLEAAE